MTIDLPRFFLPHTQALSIRPIIAGQYIHYDGCSVLSLNQPDVFLDGCRVDPSWKVLTVCPILKISCQFWGENLLVNLNPDIALSKLINQKGLAKLALVPNNL